MSSRIKIFSIEGEWEKATKNSTLSVLPGLQLLNQVEDIPFVHRTAVTHQEFHHYLKSFGKSSAFNVLYLAFHGDKGAIWFEEGELKLLDLASIYPNVFEDTTILISSCQVASQRKVIEQFKNITGAQKVAAYRKDIDFFESMILDLACLKALSRVTSRTSWKSIIEKEHPWLLEKTGLLFLE